MEVLSWEPRAYLYHNFLTHAEADHLIQKVRKDRDFALVVPKLLTALVDVDYVIFAEALLCQDRANSH